MLPYLFLICVEGFSSLLTKAEREGHIHGVSISRRAPTMSHLLLADDSLLFCHATQEEVQAISDVLQVYATSSSQCINFEKFSIFFSSNTDMDQKERIKATLGIREVDWFESYLGLPTLIGRSKNQAFPILRIEFGRKFKVGRANCYQE